jgi:hypothetical protein
MDSKEARLSPMATWKIVDIGISQLLQLLEYLNVVFNTKNISVSALQYSLGKREVHEPLQRRGT